MQYKFDLDYLLTHYPAEITLNQRVESLNVHNFQKQQSIVIFIFIDENINTKNNEM